MKTKTRITQKTYVTKFLKMENSRLEDDSLFKIVTFDYSKDGEIYPALACFVGRKAKPVLKCFFPDVTQRFEAITKFKKNVFDSEGDKIKRREAQVNFTTSCKVGDVFVSTWGYEQRNVDFYLIIEIKGNTATFVEIGQKTVEGSQCSMSCDVLPDKSNIVGQPFKKRILLGEKITLKSFEYCRKFDGKAKYKSWYY